MRQLGGLLQRAGETTRAAGLMTPFSDPTVFGHPVEHALFHLASGDVERAVPWIDRTLEQHPFGMMILIGGPYGRLIRGSSGWPILARRINLPNSAAPVA